MKITSLNVAASSFLKACIVRQVYDVRAKDRNQIGPKKIGAPAEVHAAPH
jgi:hypothetical protein